MLQLRHALPLLISGRQQGLPAVRERIRTYKTITVTEVAPGWVRAVLDTKDLQFWVRAALVTLANSRTELEEERAEFHCRKERYPKKWIGKAAYEQALAGNESARSAEACTVEA